MSSISPYPPPPSFFSPTNAILAERKGENRVTPLVSSGDKGKGGRGKKLPIFLKSPDFFPDTG